MFTELPAARKKSADRSFLIAEYRTASQRFCLEFRFQLPCEQIHDFRLKLILDNRYAIQSDFLDDVGRFVVSTKPSDFLCHVKTSIQSCFSQPACQLSDTVGRCPIRYAAFAELLSST